MVEIRVPSVQIYEGLELPRESMVELRVLSVDSLALEVSSLLQHED